MAVATPTETIAPHGGSLVNRLAGPAEAAALRDRARALPAVTLNARTLSDLDLLAVGAFSPLTGFLGSADYRSVVEDARLANGTVWPVPITLAVSEEEAAGLREGGEVALRDGRGRLVAVLSLAEKYRYDAECEAQGVYRTTDGAHPGVAALYAQGPVLLAGEVTLLERAEPEFPAYAMDPAETRRAFAERGWRTVVGFQTRNPIHRAHEYIQKVALEIVDGLLVHPLVGETKSDDIPAAVRLRCYEALLANYYPPQRTLLSVLPAAMRYAGPREAIFHAMMRKNYGCTHFIVGRDHAGVGNYYGTYDAQHVFRDFTPQEIGITPLFFEHTFFCRRCAGMASPKTCPHDESARITLSGTQVRNMLAAGEVPPVEFTRPEVAAVLIEAARS
jgi:sulfate adenylyltransferase